MRTNRLDGSKAYVANVCLNCLMHRYVPQWLAMCLYSHIYWMGECLRFKRWKIYIPLMLFRLVWTCLLTSLCLSLGLLTGSISCLDKGTAWWGTAFNEVWYPVLVRISECQCNHFVFNVKRKVLAPRLSYFCFFVFFTWKAVLPC